jgi:hypothetical protein
MEPEAIVTFVKGLGFQEFVQRLSDGCFDKQRKMMGNPESDDPELYQIITDGMTAYNHMQIALSNWHKITKNYERPV